ncbi:MAG TPA: RHS repeat-associated core domain-containing protein, partial [Trebonia sp.]|nr:RHS repeat-associated core domain-containing protein [Trebonia sp.]
MAAQAGGAGYATLSDQHGDLAALFGVSASTSGLAGTASYSPYGTVAETGAMPQAGYQGDYTDPSTGLVMMGARWYNPATGSFTSNDTIAGSPLPSTADGNPYAYTSGSPLTQADPSGHLDWTSYADRLDTYAGDTVRAVEGVGEGIEWAGLGAAAGAVAAFTAGFTIADWFFDATPVDGQDECPGVCLAGTQPDDSFRYGWRPAVGGTGTAGSTRGSAGGSAGFSPAGCTFECAGPPPPPPPPPP